MPNPKDTKKGYIFIQDNDGHWYLIPDTYADFFFHYVDAMEKCLNYDGHDFEENRVDSPCNFIIYEWKNND